MKIQPLHPDTQDLVEKLSWALEDKLLRAQRKYGFTNGWLVDDWKSECQLQLIEHLEKGDPLDVVAYAAFMWARGWSTSAAPPEQPAAAQEALRLLRKISDLAYDADVGDPLDCAIDYANKAIAVLTGSIE